MLPHTWRREAFLPQIHQVSWAVWPSKIQVIIKYSLRVPNKGFWGICLCVKACILPEFLKYTRIEPHSHLSNCSLSTIGLVTSSISMVKSDQTESNSCILAAGFLYFSLLAINTVPKFVPFWYSTKISRELCWMLGIQQCNMVFALKCQQCSWETGLQGLQEKVLCH